MKTKWAAAAALILVMALTACAPVVVGHARWVSVGFTGAGDANFYNCNVMMTAERVVVWTSEGDVVEMYTADLESVFVWWEP